MKKKKRCLPSKNKGKKKENERKVKFNIILYINVYLWIGRFSPSKQMFKKSIENTNTYIFIYTYISLLINNNKELLLINKIINYDYI